MLIILEPSLFQKLNITARSEVFVLGCNPAAAKVKRCHVSENIPS